MFSTSEISLLDLADNAYVDMWLVFRDTVPTGRIHWTDKWFAKLKSGYQHVEIWHLDRGAWIRFNYGFDRLVLQTHLDPPWRMMNPVFNPSYLHIRRLARLGYIREPFLTGPLTCCEMAKAMIGIKALFVRTPWQLYKHLRKLK